MNTKRHYHLLNEDQFFQLQTARDLITAISTMAGAASDNNGITITQREVFAITYALETLTQPITDSPQRFLPIEQ